MHRAFLEKTLLHASKIAKDYFGTVTATAKNGDNIQVLTRADIAIGRFITSEIKKLFPMYNIIDEEAGVTDKKSEYTWVIDPIDGTSNYAAAVPLFGIMIGLLYKDHPIAGGVALPAFAEICIAEKGRGALCNGKPLHVTRETDLGKVLISYSLDGHPDSPDVTKKEGKMIAEIALTCRNIRASGSAFDAIMVAKGGYGAYLFQTGKIWDHVALQSIIEEAGGVYTDFFGKPMDYTNALQRADENFTVCAGSSAIHRKVQDIIHSPRTNLL